MPLEAPARQKGIELWTHYRENQMKDPTITVVGGGPDISEAYCAAKCFSRDLGYAASTFSFLDLNPFANC